MRCFIVASLLTIGPSLAKAQDQSNDPIAAAARWADLVRAGGADQARSGASDRFRYRIDERIWRTWVEKHADHLKELGARQVLSSVQGRDEPPLEPLEWSRVVFASPWPGGGRVLEQVWSIRESGGEWETVDYRAWPDGEAIVHNADVEPIPYWVVYFPGDFGHGWRRRMFRVPPEKPSVPERPTAIANPKAFPKRPPDP
jgi:Protein of unknown function (DUF4019)